MLRSVVANRLLHIGDGHILTVHILLSQGLQRQCQPLLVQTVVAVARRTVLGSDGLADGPQVELHMHLHHLEDGLTHLRLRIGVSAGRHRGSASGKRLAVAGIDVYFDEWDKSIDRTNSHSVVSAIQRGLDRSSHLLVLLSSNALASTWVPWEVGYGYHKNEFGLTLKEVARNTLPEYLQVIPIVRGTKSLNEYVSKLTGNSEESMIRDSRLTRYNNSYHPLSGILEQTL